jgi:hypothetical protein
VDDLVSLASAALGVALSDPASLAGSDRSAVLRCRSAVGGTVVIKSYPGTEEGAEGFTAEAAGLEFTTGVGVGPDLLATDPQRRLIVMTDLGDAPSLADSLLASSPSAAKTALLGWAGACAELAVRTAGAGQAFAEVLARYQAGAKVDRPPAHWLQRRIWQVPDLLSRLSFTGPDGLAAELDQVAALLEPGPYEVFSPGDICPDNNLMTEHGVRFIDFESAEFHSVFLDAAYLRMPFSSCWCVFALPGDLAAAAERRYRDLVAGVYPGLANDEVWQRGLRLAMTAWTLHALTYLLPPSVVADGSMNSRAIQAPTARQLLRYRWARLGAELDGAGELPAVSALMRQLLTRTETWPVGPLPLYPAFRAGQARPEGPAGGPLEGADPVRGS